jgi:hypothetical protein
MTKLNRWRTVAAAAVLMGTLAAAGGCESKVNRDRFDQIQPGMSLGEVERLMGGKGEDDTPSGTSIGASGLSDTKASKRQIFRWSDKNKSIVVTVQDGRVIDKTQEGL